MKYTKDKALRIAFFIPSFKPLPMGGAESQAFLLTKYIKKQGVDVFVITPGQMGIPRFEIIDNVEVYRLPSFNFFRVRRFWKQNNLDNNGKIRVHLNNCNGNTYLKKGFSLSTYIGQFMLLIKLFGFYIFMFHRLKFKIVYLPTIFEFALPVAIFSKIFRKKLVIKDSTADGILVMPNTICPNFTKKFISKNCFFVAMTEIIKNNYLKVGILPNRISTIPNGIAIFDYKRSVPYDGVDNCLFVGNLTQQPAKGIDVLLKAWIIVSSNIPDAHLYIVGRGNPKEYYDFVEKFGISSNITFVGSANPKEYYEKSNLFILPSRREGMANALIEAMYYALPVIASEISGCKDLIDNEKNGFLVPIEDIDVLAEKIIYVLNNPLIARSMGENARITILEKCDIEDVSRLYLEFFNKVTNEC